ncbi:MAG: Gfo/Idh/MocA family oxidoreductase [Candidatus Brocadiae bacterium]|nr:Gfo/Idh/MocA family oxidoreductase [Candidatus Brocadiia bacterium]
MVWDGKLDVLVIGGGMISQEVILPTVFQERRRGKIGRVLISSLTGDILQQVRGALPGEPFEPYPDPDKEDPKKRFPDLFHKAIEDLDEKAIVIVATPDHLHTPMIVAALDAGYDVSCMKPLCLKVEEAHQIAQKAEERARYVLTDYHKRHDRAVRAARYKYRKGELGEMLHGHAWIEEPKYMPLDKFKLWAEKSSPFEYVGTHYADVYHYVTGLMPKRVVAFGQKKFLPTVGSDAYDAIQAVIEWENGSAFWIQTSWVCPDDNAKMTQQGMMFQGTKGEYKAEHADRNCYFVTDEGGFEHYNPNFMKPYDDWDTPGVKDWTGYGYESNSLGIRDKLKILAACEGKSGDEAVAARKGLLKQWSATGCRALPRQALIGVAINEAVRLSVDSGAKFVTFDERFFPKLA